MPNQKNIEIEIAGRETTTEVEDQAPKSFRIYWKSGNVNPDFKIYWPSRKDEEKGYSKKKTLLNLQNELVNLGMMEGSKVECNIDNMDVCEGAYSGVLRKKINEDLTMEYTFSYPYGGVKNFHLNNVLIQLEETQEEKLKKLLEIVKKLNFKHKAKTMKNSNNKKPVTEKKKKVPKTGKEIKKQQDVLSKL